MSYTKEPWPVFSDIATNMTPDPEGTPVAILSWDDYIRARACVNACANVPDSELVYGFPQLGSVAIVHSSFAERLERVTQERDELLAENKELKQSREFDAARTGVLARLVNAAYPENKAAQLECIGTILGSVRLATEGIIKERDELLSVLEGIESVTPHHMAKQINDAIASIRKSNGQCYYAPDGTLMSPDGTRSIFDDVDQ